METAPGPAYPATLSIDYPDRPLDRLTSAFRIFTAIPIAIVFAALTGSSQSTNYHYSAAHGMVKDTSNGIAVTAGILFFSTLLMILFRQKYPRWWYDWNLQFTRFGTRVGAYFALLRDEYPSTDEEQSVHIQFPYPDAKQLNRWLPLVKWLLAFPHYIVLVCLFFAAVFCTIFAWFAILFTGRYPKGLFDFVVGVQRWALRVSAYAAILVTDKYPPFSLD